MNPDDLIQLMRLSSTSAVRAYLHDLYEQVESDPNGNAALVYSGLIDMFKQCKRADISEAWPPSS